MSVRTHHVLNNIKAPDLQHGGLALGERVQKDDSVYDIVHSQHFVLVDKAGQIRGYYPADGPGRKRLVADLTQLLG